MAKRDTAATLAYHEATKHSERSTRESRHFLDFDNQPLPFKLYRELEAIPLPRFAEKEVPALQAIAASSAPSPGGERIPDLPALV